MSIPITFIPAKKRRRRARRPVVQQPPAEPPVLVAVGYEPGVSVTLAFDRAIDAAAFVPGVLQVHDDAITGQIWNGTAWTPTDPQTIVVTLVAVGQSFLPGTTLSVPPDNGITSADGTAWAGVVGVAIPFG